MATSVTLEDITKERLEQYRTPDHDNYSETLESLFTVVPTPTEMLADGCVECDDSPYMHGTDGQSVDDIGGVTFTFTADAGGGREITDSLYFCSPECLREHRDRGEKYVPDEPDLVRVGGADELPVELDSAGFGIDGESMWVTIDAPGAFRGESTAVDVEFDYEGEPIYVRNGDDWVQEGVVEEIHHEETRTTLSMCRDDYETMMLNHPDDERREKYKEDHVDDHGDSNDAE